MRVKLDYANFSLAKKIKLALVAASVIFFLVVGSLLLYQMKRVFSSSEKERLELQSVAFGNTVQRSITASRQMVNLASISVADMLRSGSLGDSSMQKWLTGVNASFSRNLYATVTNPATGQVQMYGFASNGAASGGQFVATDLGAEKEVTIATSSDKHSFIKVAKSQVLPDGRTLVVGALVPFSEMVAQVNVRSNKDSINVLVVNGSGDILLSNVGKFEGKGISSIADGSEALAAASIKHDEKVARVSFDDDTYYATYMPFSLIDAQGGVLFLSPRSGMAVGLFFSIMLIILIVWFAMVLGMNYLFNMRLLNPIFTVISSLKSIGQGKISDDIRLEVDRKDEIGQMMASVNELVDSFVETAIFAKGIGEGKLDSSFKPRGEDDKLGIALIGMQQSLKKAKEIEEAQKESSRKSQWANEGMARFSEILRNNHDNLKQMSFDVIKALVKSVDAIQGGVFVLNDDVEGDQFLEMTACFAYDRKKMHQKRVEIGEGLVGRCFFEKQPILLKEIPDDYLEITSGLGQKNPNYLILIPLKINDTVNGVIEIASFSELEDYQIQFVEKIAESISSTITSVRINERTTELLERSQVQGEQMAAQEEEMRQNLEELQATQEELEKRARENDEMNKALEKEKYLLDALLANIPDFIYFKDEQCRFIRVSESMAPLFKASCAAELVGKSDFDFHSAEHANRSYQEEMEIVRTGKKIIDNVVHEVWDDGREQWVSSTKMPLVASDGRIVGSFGISKVITDMKRMELEMTAQNDVLKSSMAEMEEASQNAENVKAMYTKIIDNLPLKVFVKDHSGKMVVVNAAVAKAHGLKANELIGKSDFDFYGHDEAMEVYQTELEVMDGKTSTYVHKEHFEGGDSKILRTTKMPFFIDTIKEKGLLGVQIDVTEFANIHNEANS